MIDDAELLRRFAQHGSEAAFNEVVRRHIGFVFATAQRKLGYDRHAAEDVVQQVFEELARIARRPGGPAPAVLAGWLYTVARNKAAQIVRSEQRRRRRHDQAQAMNDIADDAARHAEWERLRPVIDEAMSALSSVDRDAILLRFFEGRPYAEIGARFSLSPGAARLRVARALEAMRPAFAQRGISSTSAAIIALLTAEAAIAAPAGLAASVAASAMSVGAGGSAAAALLQLMATNKIAAIICAAAFAVGIGGAVQAHRLNRSLAIQAASLQAAEQASADLRRENVSLAKTLADAQALEASNRIWAEQLAEAPSVKADVEKLQAQLAARGAKAKTARPSLSDSAADTLRRLQPVVDAKNWLAAQTILAGFIAQSAPNSYDRFVALDTLAKVDWQGLSDLAGTASNWEQLDEILEAHPEYFSAGDMIDHRTFEFELNWQIGQTKSGAVGTDQWFPASLKGS